MPDIDDILTEAVDAGASDVYLKTDRPPLYRVAGRIVPTEREPLSQKQLDEMVKTILPPSKSEELKQRGQTDFAYAHGHRARFRMNAFLSQGGWNLVCRKIATEVPTLDQLALPSVIKDVLAKTQGLILVTGPAGSGKSTTLAAMVTYLNQNRQCHIITIEDPIEYVHQDEMAVIHQREIGSDVVSFPEALKGALRQDPDVLLIGEMRDQESAALAITAAETGHLVMSTLHTNSAGQTIDRMVGMFPDQLADQIRLQLSQTLLAVFSQRLAVTSDGRKRTAVVEVMVNSPSIQKLIEEGHTHDLKKTISQSGHVYRMQTFNQALLEKVEAGIITREEAMRVSPDPKELNMLLKGVQAAISLGSVTFKDGEFV